MSAVQQPGIVDLIREATGISEENIQKALEVQRETREPLPQTLSNMGLIGEKDKAKILGRQWGIPYIDLTEQPADSETVRLLPQNLLQRVRAVPVSKQGNRLAVAMVNPLDIFAIDQLRLVAGAEIDTLIATEDDVNTTLAHVFSGQEDIGDTLKQVTSEISNDGDLKIETRKSQEEEMSIDQLKEMVDDAPIIRLVNMIIRQALRDKASDIHLQPEANRMRVRYRIDGILQDPMSVPKQVQAPLISRIKVMGEMDIAEKRKPQDGRISLTMGGREFDFRVSTYPGVNGEKVVMRVLDKRGVQVSLSRLGMSSGLLEDIEALLNRSYGIVCVTGPTGSGKSTTLYACLNRLNSPEKNILTVEDPVEYQLPGLTQGQVNIRAGITFASALKTMLRQDPDIILVGEMRDPETALIATEAALTGHLVFSTLHTNDAPGAVARLMEMGIEPFLIASSVIGVLAQRLVRKICPECKEAYTPAVDAFRRLNLAMDTDSVTFYRGRGCEKCRGTGYSGRIAIFELMAVNDHIRELILKRAPSHALRQEALEAGMVTLRQDAMQKILEGTTTMEEALRVVYTG